jgi:hypothetical protein
MGSQNGLIPMEKCAPRIDIGIVEHSIDARI